MKISKRKNDLKLALSDTYAQMWMLSQQAVAIQNRLQELETIERIEAEEKKLAKEKKK